MMRRVGAIPLLLTFVCAPPSRAEDLKASLDRPLSPGSVALLVWHAREAAVRDRWAAALKDPRPDVRAAAARAINVSNTASLVPQLGGALAVETELDAGGEEIRALGALSFDASLDDQILSAAKRLGTAAPAAEALARRRGVGAIRYLPMLRSISHFQDNADTFLSVATEGGRRGLTLVAATVLQENHPDLWKTTLKLVRESAGELEPATIVAALRSGSEEIRNETRWHLAMCLSEDGTLAADVRAAVGADLDASAAKVDDADAAFGVELLARLMDRRPIEQAAWIAQLGKDAGIPHARDLAGQPSLLKRLTPAELTALSDRRFRDPKRLSSSTETPPPPSRRKTAEPGETPMWTLADFPRGLVADVLAVTGCKGSASQSVAGANISYGPDGRPGVVSVMDLPVSPECQVAARTLFACSLARPGHLTRPETPETALFLLGRDSLACLAEEEAPRPKQQPGPAPVAHVGLQMKKLRDVRPGYPEGARRQRVQGTVLLEAVIAASGCVRSLDVLRGVHPSLDSSAIKAVSQWRYTPTLLDGVPVPVIMTVTVNYRLN